MSKYLFRRWPWMHRVKKHAPNWSVETCDLRWKIWQKHRWWQADVYRYIYRYMFTYFTLEESGWYWLMYCTHIYQPEFKVKFAKQKTTCVVVVNLKKTFKGWGEKVWKNVIYIIMIRHVSEMIWFPMTQWPPQGRVDLSYDIKLYSNQSGTAKQTTSQTTQL